jgi:hypothetical protein
MPATGSPLTCSPLTSGGLPEVRGRHRICETSSSVAAQEPGGQKQNSRQRQTQNHARYPRPDNRSDQHANDGYGAAQRFRPPGEKKSGTSGETEKYHCGVTPAQREYAARGEPLTLQGQECRQFERTNASGCSKTGHVYSQVIVAALTRRVKLKPAALRTGREGIHWNGHESPLIHIHCCRIADVNRLRPGSGAR